LATNLEAEMGFFSKMLGGSDTGVDQELLKKAETGDAEAQCN
jgi:hypothetical protein